MKFIRFVAVSLLAAALFSCVEPEFETGNHQFADVSDELATKITGGTDGEFHPTSFLVYIDESLVEKWESGDHESVVKAVASDVDVVSFAPALQVKPKNERLARELGLHRWFEIEFAEEGSLVAVSERVAKSSRVKAIQYKSVTRLVSDCTPIAVSKAAAPKALPYFNDYYHSSQWNLVNDGTVSDLAVEGADVSVRDAWRLTCGNPRIIVAVLDGPVKYTHEDLAANMWVNTAEKNGTPGVDDDGNDYVDDIYGYNFAERTGNINWNASGEIGHGTHVAGIVAAVNNNGIGVSSIAGGSGNGDGVRLMSCQLYAGDKGCTDGDVAKAFIYAADNGACIAQCSYGVNGGSYTSDNAYIGIAPFECQAIQYFIAPENANCPSVGANIAIFAAGNETTSYSSYPGALNSCVSVTAFGPDFRPALYTNYGLGCNIAAPGGEDAYTVDDKILSTGLSEILEGGHNYFYMAGSSMACPHVSGVAALGMSYALELGKSFSGEEFKSMLLTSVADMDQYFANGGRKTAPDGSSIDLKKYYKRMGTGAVDAWRLLMQVEGTPSVMVRQGESCKVNLSDYFGESAANLTYLGVEVDDADRSALGISILPTVKNGVMTIKCSKLGSGKVRVKAIAGGGQLGGPLITGGSEIFREVSVISRGVFTENNGWF